MGGLDSAVLKSATLSSDPWSLPLAPLRFQAEAIVAVAVEPADAAQLPQLLHGLTLLNRADPFVEVRVAETGEHVVAAAGAVSGVHCEVPGMHIAVHLIRGEVLMLQVCVGDLLVILLVQGDLLWVVTSANVSTSV